MKEQINGILQKLENIPVNGVNAILMGEALKELIIIRDELPDEAPEPEEGEKNVNSND